MANGIHATERINMVAEESVTQVHWLGHRWCVSGNGLSMDTWAQSCSGQMTLSTCGLLTGLHIMHL